MSKQAMSATKPEPQPAIQIKEGTYKVASTTLEIETDSRVELKEITDEIVAFVALTPIREGFVQISSLHTTAGLMLNEIQDALLADMVSMFEQVIPRTVYYKHNDPMFSECERRNADSHLRAIMLGHNITIPVEDGKLKLGTWQRVLFGEFDGPNSRKIHVQVMGV
ncbi:MAG: YjbQ family protein [Acidobacteria bacterium]|nr:YjbQ family protein [Acidobacteriota bacterium]